MSLANCKGCIWLDANGRNGYCSEVVRSATYRAPELKGGKLIPSNRVRLPDMERCELYEPGEFARRWRDADVAR